MRNSKHGLKALVLAIMAAALGTMAFAAVGAQATEPGLNPNPLASPSTNTAGLFLINGGNVLLATIAASQINPGYLLVATRDLKLECTGLTLSAGSKINNATDASGEVTFTGCLSFSLSSGEHLPCVLTTLGTITAKALAKPILHNGEEFVLFEPSEAGKPFTTVSYKPGTECPLPPNNPVNGSVTALVDVESAEKLPNRLILFSPGIQLLTGDVLSFGGNRAYIDAHGEVSLSGEHLGDKLDIH